MTLFPSVLRPALRSLIAALVAATALLAQCEPAFGTGPGANGVDRGVLATTEWDPDGSGPNGPVLVLGGTFQVFGLLLANHIATWDPVTGSPGTLGAGLDGDVFALRVMPNGDLLAGGRFRNSGGSGTGGVARWTSTGWVPVGNLPRDVFAFEQLPNGDLVAGCENDPDGVMRWDGTTWSALGGGLLPGFGASVYALARLPSGDLVAGGYFAGTTSVTYGNLARWNGTAWAPFAGGGVAGSVHALAATQNGDLYVGGLFWDVSGVAAQGIARFDGTSWSSPGGAQFFRIDSLRVARSGDLLAGGTSLGGGVQRWNGTTWTQAVPAIGGPPLVNTITELQNGELIAGGTFTSAGAQRIRGIAIGGASGWRSLVVGTPATTIAALEYAPNGDVFAAGNFSLPQSPLVTPVARWNGSTWTPVGVGAPVSSLLLRLRNAHLIAGDSTTLARFDGTSWQTIGTGLGAAASLLELPTGDVVIGTGGLLFLNGTAVAALRWDGTSMSAFAPAAMAGRIAKLAQLDDGSLVAVGPLGVGVERFDGVSWTTIPFPVLPRGSAATAVLAEAGGRFVVAVNVPATTGSGTAKVLRWNGASFDPVGGDFAGSVAHLVRLPNGDLAAGGEFSENAGVPMIRLARFDGAAWRAFVGAVDAPILAIAVSDDGRVGLGGTFARAGDLGAGPYVEIVAPCPALAQTVAAGCTSAVLASTKPWTGTTWEAQATGLPPLAVAFAVTGFAPTSQPLSSLFATGVPGCVLSVRPDHVGAELVAGSASVRVDVPNDPALAGAVAYHQMLAVALDGTLAVTATNALRLVVGSY